MKLKECMWVLEAIYNKTAIETKTLVGNSYEWNGGGIKISIAEDDGIFHASITALNKNAVKAVENLKSVLGQCEDLHHLSVCTDLNI